MAHAKILYDPFKSRNPFPITRASDTNDLSLIFTHIYKALKSSQILLHQPLKDIFLDLTSLSSTEKQFIVKKLIELFEFGFSTPAQLPTTFTIILWVFDILYYFDRKTSFTDAST